LIRRLWVGTFSLGLSLLLAPIAWDLGVCSDCSSTSPNEYRQSLQHDGDNVSQAGSDFFRSAGFDNFARIGMALSVYSCTQAALFIYDGGTQVALVKPQSPGCLVPRSNCET
jgi:hypothetical protein